MKQIEEQEKEIKKLFEAIEVKPFDEIFAEIEPRLKKKPKAKSKRKNIKVSHLFAMAASFVFLLTGGGLMYYFLSRDTKEENNGPRYFYTDEFVVADFCDVNDLISHEGLRLPDLTMLIESFYKVGKHTETGEIVYFQGYGLSISDISLREIDFTIIIVDEYLLEGENDYLNLPNTCSAGDIKVSYSQPTVDNFFFSYKVSIRIDDVRYYFNYKTIEEDDIAVFFTEFFK